MKKTILNIWTHFIAYKLFFPSVMNLSRLSATFAAPGQPRILSAAFNQDAGCLALGLDSGFRVFNTEPLAERRRVGAYSRAVCCGVVCCGG